MKARKTAADEAKRDEGPTFLKSWGGKKNPPEPPVSQEPQDDVSKI